MILLIFYSLFMVMPASASPWVGGGLFSLDRGAGLAKSVENGATAVHRESVVRGNVGEQLLADGALQVDETVAGHAFQVEMAGTIPTYWYT